MFFCFRFWLVYVTKHHYEGVICGCTISHNNHAFSIDLLADTGFDGDLILPREICEQLQLKQSDRYNTAVFGSHESLIEYETEVMVTVTMDDGSQRVAHLQVSSRSSYSSSSSSSSSSSTTAPSTTATSSLLYDPTCSSDSDSSLARSPIRPLSIPVPGPTKQLLPVKSGDHKTSKYISTDCLLGFYGLRRLKLGVNPEKCCLSTVLVRPTCRSLLSART